jgi:hypothetical protein
MRSNKLAAFFEFIPRIQKRLRSVLGTREGEFERTIRENGVSALLNPAVADAYPLHVKPAGTRPSARVVARARFRD